MDLFKTFGELSYEYILQLDGAFPLSHINYGRTPLFNKTEGRKIAVKSRKHSISLTKKVTNVCECRFSFDGTEKGFNKTDRAALWKSYWLEYINAFDKLTEICPDSVATIYIGRQAIELGLKYLLLKKTGKICSTHNLANLCDKVYSAYHVKNMYMDCVDIFCQSYEQYIEGGNAEYFKYPEYKNEKFFAGNALDIRWISYNFALILLKLLHLAKLDSRFSGKRKKCTNKPAKSCQNSACKIKS